MPKVDFKANQPCRYFHVHLTPTQRQRHYGLMQEFITRHILSPQGGTSGPAALDGGEEGNSFHIFWLDERVADEYVRRMESGED